MIPPAYQNRVALSRREVAETLGRSERFVDSLIRDRKLKARRVRTTVFVLAYDVWALVGLCEKKVEISDRAREMIRGME